VESEKVLTESASGSQFRQRPEKGR